MRNGSKSCLFIYALAMMVFMIQAGHVAGSVYISEILTDNESGIRDEDGDREDWIELYNNGDSDVNLDGWWLSDNQADPTQWRIPAVSIPAKGYLFVWASGKNRSVPSYPLHSNFSLSKSGEYIGLYSPNPTNGLPVLADAFAPAFPAIPSDVSYGRMFAQVTTNVLSIGDAVRYRVLTSSEGDAFYFGTNYVAGHLGHNQPGGWNVSPAFDDSAWTNATTGIGYDTTGNFNTWIGTSPDSNCSNALRNINTSLCLRRTFDRPQTNLTSLTLRMKYEDGFVAFINGVEVGRANCTNAMAYNTKANAAVDESVVNAWYDYTVSTGLLVQGTNVLAVQGLNSSLTSSDFLVLPTLFGMSSMFDGTLVYFSAPTPETENGCGTAGPLIFDATPADPDIPRPLGGTSSPPMTVTVRVIKTEDNIATVKVFYRTMWNSESAAVPLLDDGVAPDAVATDGVYSCSLSTTGPTAGQMLRWRFEAVDTQSVISRLPAYVDATNSPKYFGTVAVDSATATSQLSVLEWFVQGSPSNGPTAAAFRGCCYYLTNFYDNTGHEIHGQSTAGFAKKSYDFDFTAEKRFLWKADEERVKDINLLSNYADKTKTRNTFSQWVGIMTDTPHHFCYPVRVHLNGVFHGVMDMMEDGDDKLLERNGLDPEGAFYKIYNTVFTTSPEKKTRKTEDNSDLQALYNGLDTALALSNRQTFAYDNVDIAASVNYLVTRFLNSDVDHGHKNYYLYRDTLVTREWCPIVWDVDLSQGHVWNSTENYFDDDLITNTLFTVGSSSRLYNIIYSAPEMKEMFVRRMKTLMDTLLQPPGTTNGIFETRMREIVASVDPDPADPSPSTDGDLDAARWGIDYRFSQNRPREEVERVIANYFAPRREFLFSTGTGRPTYNGLNIPEVSQTNVAGMVLIDSIDFRPASSNQAHEYVILRNATTRAVDISGWTVDGQISFTFKGGTVIPAGDGTEATNYVGLLHLVKDAYAFRARPGGPTGGQRRFIQGNYSGQLSARGGTVNLRDNTGLLIATHTYAGDPTPAQQQLRITELQYNPADPTPAEAATLIGVKADDFEYIELLNIGLSGLSMSNAWFSQGIEFVFPGINISPGQCVILSEKPAAFAIRYPSVTNTVLGPYQGTLDNGGERLELKDACGETIFDFVYRDGWYPVTDGTGRSLVVRDSASAQDALGEAETWGISIDQQGTPGSNDTQLAQAYCGWDNFHFTSGERDDPLVSGPYADPDGDGRLNWAEYAFDTDPRIYDLASIALTFVTISEVEYAALVFNRVSNALDLEYNILATNSLTGEGLWSPAGSAVYHATSLGNSREIVTLSDLDSAAAGIRFLRLRVTYRP